MIQTKKLFKNFMMSKLDDPWSRWVSVKTDLHNASILDGVKDSD